MDLQTLRNRVQRELRRLKGELVAPAVVDAYLNDGGDEFARLTRCIRASTQINLTADTATYDVPAGALEVLRVYDVDGLALRFTDYRHLDRIPDWRSETSTRPFQYLMQDAETILLYPKPSENVTNGLRVDTVQGWTTLTGDTDVPTLPAKYHLALVWFACNQVLPSDDFSGRYQALLTEAKGDSGRNFSTAPRSIPYRYF